IMGFFLFLLVTATLLIRPSEQIEELQATSIYEPLILVCFAFSFGSVLEQFSLKNLETRPITICVLGLLVAAVLSQLVQANLTGAGNAAVTFLKILVYYVLLVGNVSTAQRLRIFVIWLGFCSLL